MTRFILFILAAVSLSAGRDEWTFANDSSSTLEVSIWEIGGSGYSTADIVQPGSKVTILATPDGAQYEVYVDNRTTLVNDIWFNVPSSGWPTRKGQHRLWHVSDAGAGVGPVNFRERFETTSIEDSGTNKHLQIFLSGMGLAATVILVRIGLRWSRVLLADQDGG